MRRYVAATAPAVLLVLSVWTTSAAPANVRKPAVLSFSLSTQHLSYLGGTVRLSARVANATTCTFGAAAIRPMSVKCRSGFAHVVERIAPNTSANSETIRFWVQAKGPGDASGRAFFSNGGTTLYVSRAPTPTTTTRLATP
ncbi:MAG: hypothetical protein ACHQFZ_06255 [Acidimicrobiales bacterium]